MDKKLIIVSNPVKQHTPYLVKAILLSSFEVQYYTTYWYKPKGIVESIVRITFTKLNQFITKRYDPSVNQNIVHSNPIGILILLFLRVINNIERRSYYEDIIHDYYVSKHLKRKRPFLFFGAEKASLHSFRAVKNYGGICVLDCAQVHPSFIDSITMKYDFMLNVVGGRDSLFYIGERKRKEIAIANKIIVLSDFAASTFYSENISTNQVYKVRLGITKSIEVPKQITATQPLKVLFVGILTARKGLLDLIEIANKSIDYPIQFLLAGSKAEISIDNMPKNVAYLGHLPQELLSDLYFKSDVLLLPTYLDSWGMVVADALAHGLPVITTINCGASELINSESGFVVQPGDIREIMSILSSLLHNPKQLLSLKNKSREAVIDTSWECYSSSINELINHLIKTDLV